MSSSGYELKLNIYNTNIIFWEKFKGLEDAISTLESTVEETKTELEESVEDTINSLIGPPKYSSAVTVSIPYTATKTGWCQCYIIAGNASTEYVYVNGVSVCQTSSPSTGTSTYAWGVTNSAVFPVSKGDVVTVNDTTRTKTLKFMPCIS